MKSMYDGLLICNGPMLEVDYESVKVFDFKMIVSVNHAYKRIKCDREIYWVSVTPIEHMMKTDPDINNKVVPVYFKNKTGMNSLKMEKDDYPPFLVNPGVSLFCALHYMVCKGMKNIVSVGLNLEPWPGGTYNRNGASDGRHIFENIKRIFHSYTNYDLHDLGVSFLSASLFSYPPKKRGPV